MPKAAFISILGNPNAGKSTLLNAILGQKLSIITPKAQTTRHRIIGILNEGEYQMVFNDTPGYVQAKYKLHQRMMDALLSTLEDCDIVLLLASMSEKPSQLQDLIQLVQKQDNPVFLILNKIDEYKPDQVLLSIAEWNAIYPFKAIIPVSALKHKNVELIIQEIKKCMPEAPWYYTEDELSDRNERYFASEIIREKIFLNLAEEIPYHTEVVIEDWKEKPDLHSIRAIIYCGKDSHKNIIIGKNASMIKKIGTESRIEIETMTEKKVFLDITVKVKENWREDDNWLKRVGY